MGDTVTGSSVSGEALRGCAPVRSWIPPGWSCTRPCAPVAVISSPGKPVRAIRCTASESSANTTESPAARAPALRVALASSPAREPPGCVQRTCPPAVSTAKAHDTVRGSHACPTSQSCSSMGPAEVEAAESTLATREPRPRVASVSDLAVPPCV